MAKTIHPFPAPSRGSDSELAYASPRGSTDEAGKEGWDKRKRRLRGYVNDKGELTKDGFCNELRRAGGPYLCSLPIESGGIPDEHRLAKYHSIKAPNGEDLIIHIYSMLRDRNIRLGCEGDWPRPTNIGFCLRRSKFNPEPEAIPTIIIKANRDIVNNAWLKAARDIYALLCEINLDYVSVEFITHCRDDPPYTFPVLDSHPICDKWDAVLAAILRDVDLTDICAIGCYMRGRSEDRKKTTPTVLVIADCNSTRNWRHTREIVVKHLDKAGLYMVAVEVVKDRIFITRPPHPKRTGFKPDLLEGPTIPGGPISNARTDKQSGTLGGFIELQGPSLKWHRFALTCFNCIDPLDEDVDKRDLAGEHCFNEITLLPSYTNHNV